MARPKVSLEGLGDAINDILQEFGEEASLANIAAIEHATNEGLRKIRSNSRAQGWPKYASGWNKEVKKSRLKAEGVLYNDRPGLPHLLEKGHAKKGGGRVEGRVHIAPVQDAIDKAFEQAFKEKLK